MYEEIEDWTVGAEEFFELEEKCQRIPKSIRKDMNEAGMFKKERKNVDEYINEGVASISLDRELIDEHPSQFVMLLKGAINRNDNFVIDEVIEDMGGLYLVVKTIVKSGKQPLIKKLLKRKAFTNDAMEYMVKSQDKRLIRKVAELAELPEFIKSMIIKTGDRNSIKILLKKHYLMRKDIYEILELNDKEFDSLVAKRLKR